jgi:hypothetical protein
MPDQAVTRNVTSVSPSPWEPLAGVCGNGEPLERIVSRRRYVARGVPGGYRIWDNKVRVFPFGDGADRRLLKFSAMNLWRAHGEEEVADLPTPYGPVKAYPDVEDWPPGWWTGSCTAIRARARPAQCGSATFG